MKTYYAVRKRGSLGVATAVVTDLGPDVEALAAFTDLAEARQYFLSQETYRLTSAYRGEASQRRQTSK